MVTSITVDTFSRDVLDADTPVLVDVWAPWCGPCKMVEPVIKSVDQKTGRDVKVIKMNADHNRDLMYEYNIASIPTLLFFNHGHLVARMTGVQGEQRILDKLTEIKDLDADQAAQQAMVGGMSRQQMLLMGGVITAVVVAGIIALVLATL